MKQIYFFSFLKKTYLPVLMISCVLAASAEVANAQQHHSSTAKLFKLAGQHQQKLSATTLTAVEGIVAYQAAAATITKPRTRMEYYAEGNNWVHVLTVTSTYDNMGRLTEEVQRERDGTNVARTTITYDTRGNETEDISYQWNGTNWAITGGYQTLYTYDSNGRITEEIEKDWSNGSWVSDYRTVFAYNSSGDLITATDYEWRGTGWNIDYSYTFHYAAPNTPPNGITMMEANQAGVLVNVERIINLEWNNFSNPKSGYGIFDDQQIRSYISQEWRNGNWVNEYKEEYTYGTNNSMVISEYDWINNAWVNNSRSSLTNDAQGNQVLFQGEDLVNGAWVITYGYRTTYTYNTANQVTEQVAQYWDTETRAYVNTFRTVFSNFQTISSAPAEVAALLTEVYPNPTSGTITIRHLQPAPQATLKITDITGKTVLIKQLTPAVLQQELDLSAFPSGLYLLQLQSSDLVATRKIIKQ